MKEIDNNEEWIADYVKTVLKAIEKDSNALIKRVLGDIMDNIPEDSETFDKIEFFIEQVNTHTDFEGGWWFSRNIDFMISELTALGLKDEASKLYSLEPFKKDFENQNSHQPCVYFIRNNVGRVKIGFTHNIKQRLNTLRSSSGDDLEILYTYRPNNIRVNQLENRLHIHFAKQRLFGEWFNLDIESMDFPSLCLHYDK